MNNVIEILFEDVEFDRLSECLNEIGAESELVNYQISTDDSQSNEKVNDLSNLTEFINKYKEGSIYLNLEIFRLGNFLLPKVGIQILKYATSIDLSIDIDYSHFQSFESLRSIQSWAQAVSDKLLAKSYCCGYEPASDEDTRFFTMDELGPLRFRKKDT